MSGPIFFADRHHAGLAYSLHLLVQRLGGTLYFPIGMGWADQGYWQIHKPYNYNIDTARQYLQIQPEYTPMDGTSSLNYLLQDKATHYEVYDVANDYRQKLITTEQFQKMKIDYVIASIPDHFATFDKLIQDYAPQAKLICQYGNIWWTIGQNLGRNVLASIKEQYSRPDQSVCYYHQELDLTVFKPDDRKPTKQITSLINCLKQTGHSDKYYCMKELLPGFEFFSYGASCDDGILKTTRIIAEVMKDSMWGWHAKMYGDGMGHIVYGWMSVGRPVITCFSDYNDKLGGELLEDGVTAIDLDRYTIAEVCDKIRTMPNDTYEHMCRNAYERFKTCVNYDSEETKIRDWLTKLQ